MKKILYILLLISIFGFTNSFADCETDYIKSKTSDGSVIILSNEDAWEIDSIDRINTELWMPMDDVIVCDDDSIIHKEDGEKVGAKKIN